ncbi:sigma-70 family RNA polymerase sigma factor [Tenacibaculum sp. 190524A05c]|uniref:RNA polymerase sigma factor n=1 Tax=Tenacibaculum platacis TaxID=3137852 RepID=UPI0032B14CF2
MPIKKVHTDQKYIEALLNNNSFVIREIYSRFVPKVVNFICNNSGNTEKAEDVIQEVLITLYKQAKEKELQLTCPFDAYFFLLCKRKWLNELKKNKNIQVTILNEEVSKFEGLEELVLETSVFEQKNELFESTLQTLGKACKDLLKVCFSLKSMEEVSKKLNISYAYARKKKSQCIGQLTKLIKASPKYKEIKNNS